MPSLQGSTLVNDSERQMVYCVPQTPTPTPWYITLYYIWVIVGVVGALMLSALVL